MQNENDERLKRLLSESPQGVAELIKSAAHPARITILSSLAGGEGAFSELERKTGLSKNALMNHLTLLMENGLVNRVARGEYSLTADGDRLIRAAAGAYLDSQKREEIRKEGVRRSYMHGIGGSEKRMIEKPARYQPAWLSYTGAMAGALRSLGVSCDSIEVGGRSGYAFIVNVAKGVLSPAGPTALPDDTWIFIREGTEDLGYKLRHYCEESAAPEKNGPSLRELEKMKRLYELTKKEIDEDRPVVMWGLAIPEYGIVNGYEGLSYLVSTVRSVNKQPETRISFHELNAPGCYDAYFFKKLVEVDHEESDRNSLERAAEFASGEFPVANGFIGGPGALEEWASALENSKSEDYFANSYVGECVWEGREMAAEYLNRLASRRSGACRDHLMEASTTYWKGASTMKKFVSLFPFPSGAWTNEKRAFGASLLREVGTLEVNASQALRRALEACQ